MEENTYNLIEKLQQPKMTCTETYQNENVNGKKNWQYTKNKQKEKGPKQKFTKNNREMINFQFKFLKITNIVSKTLILDAHEAIPCAPK